MEISEVLSLSVGIIGTSIAIYQAAIIRTTNQRHRQLQYLLAGISNIALGKQQEWVNQGYFLSDVSPENQDHILRLHARARDGFSELANAVSALEGTIDPDRSAITDMLRKNIEQVKLNNELQAEGLKNPTLPENQNAQAKEH